MNVFNILRYSTNRPAVQPATNNKFVDKEFNMLKKIKKILNLYFFYVLIHKK